MHSSIRTRFCLLLSLLLIGCQSDTRAFLSAQRSIAHAGGVAAGRAYTNSLQALQSSRSIGFRIIEIDLNWTQDGELVLIHDWGKTWHTLFNQTGIPTLEEFESAGMTDGLTNLTLAEAMDWLSENPDVYFVTDVKDKNIPALRKIMEQYDTARIIPQIYEVAEFVKAKDLGYTNIILTTYRTSTTPQEIIDFASNNSIWAVTAPYYQIDRGDYDRLIAMQSPLVFTHTINDPGVWEQLEKKGVDAIYTDTLFIPSNL